ncbi:DUF565 domain-containing protein [Limnofasciculus baicalensis]|uniref:DUF565 domain-containing protein n=1 Tax=Limnofasciculus baicalensis BBK-W-15 TaxID=2699891 RepID=A0AAE3GXL2_9CYAN|nr:DUF565 domain-containing protein [Limnofasciculus baicalensis]MCP2732551.1 DUF565 domain-containing protein [Limnofasciculus baicalensis BBK-W-15]
MQNTRLNNLVNVILGRLGQWFGNPWRRLSLILISLLLGVFLGTAIPTTTGQAANWDAIAAAILIVITEAISRLVYGRSMQQLQTSPFRFSLIAETINALKIGLSYSLFLEAFKLGS